MARKQPACRGSNRLCRLFHLRCLPTHQGPPPNTPSEPPPKQCDEADPPTPDSTVSSDPISSNISPCLPNASPDVKCLGHLSLFEAPTPTSEESSDFGHSQPPSVFTPFNSTDSLVVEIPSRPVDEQFRRQSFGFLTDPSQDDPALSDTPCSSSNSSTFFLASSNPVGASRCLDPLSTEGRESANQTRDTGACLRCSCMKEKCDRNSPCGNCRNQNGGKWRLGCVRDTLESRARQLFPPPIANRYNIDHTNRYINSSGFFYLNKDAFQLSLSMGLGGPPFEVTVKEVEPVERQRLLRCFQADTKDDYLKTSTFWDPPVVLYLTDKEKAVEDLRRQLQRSMHAIFNERHETGYQWPWKNFDFDRMNWIGEIVETIHDFGQRAGNMPFYSSIRKAQGLLYFNYVLDHPMLVLGEEREKLFALLEPQEDVEYKLVSPETIQRFIKAIAYPFLTTWSAAILKELHELLLSIAKAEEVSSAKNDLAFCLSFMMLVFIGQTQARLVLLSQMSEEEKDIRMTHTDAQEYIETLEEQLGTYIIHFHDFAMKMWRQPQAPSSDTPEEQYAAQYGLIGKIAEITQKFHKCKPTTFDVGELDYAEFEKENIHRLCWKLVDAINSPVEPCVTEPPADTLVTLGLEMLELGRSAGEKFSTVPEPPKQSLDDAISSRLGPASHVTLRDLDPA